MGRSVRSFTFDAAKTNRSKRKDKFNASTTAEREFYRALKKVAQTAGRIVDVHVDGDSLVNEKAMQKALVDYANTITPWARRQSEKLLQKVQRANKRDYKRESKKMGQLLNSGVGEAKVGQVAISLMEEQVALIRSIPIEAGLRAQRIAADNFFSGKRAAPDDAIVSRLTEERVRAIAMHNQMVELSGEGKTKKEELARSTEIAVNRAKLIARTETARANSAFVQARAAAVGVQGYIWRTTMDGAERKSHAKMNGKYVEYAKPPTLSDGTTGHAGTFPNCRCYQEPVLPEDVE